MYCPYCDNESKKSDVCTECGTVFSIRNIIVSDPNAEMDREKEGKSEPIYNEFFGPLSPDIEYRHKYAKRAKGKELNRALRRQKKRYMKKPESYFYKKDYTKISGFCSVLRLPNGVREEALNLRVQVGNLKSEYFKRNNLYKCVACIKLACRIRDFPVEERELISLIRGYKEPEKLKGNKHKKIIDNEYKELRKITGIIIERFPKSPNYIAYICNKVGLKPSDEEIIRTEYQLYLEKFKRQFSLKGYILAIIYLKFKKEYKIRLTDLENISGVSRTTIASRVRDIKKIWGVI